MDSAHLSPAVPDGHFAVCQGRDEEQSREEALEGSQAFCFELLMDVVANGVYLMSGNRCDLKVVPTLLLPSLEKGADISQW